MILLLLENAIGNAIRSIDFRNWLLKSANVRYLMPLLSDDY